MAKKTRQTKRQIDDSRAKQLKGYGFRLTYKQGRRNSPQAKAAVTRLWNSHVHFINAKEHPVKFVPFKSDAEKRTVHRLHPKEAIAPGGFWVQEPKGIKPRKWTVKVEKDHIRERINGRADDIIVPLSGGEFAADPRGYVEGLVKKWTKRTKGKKPLAFRLMVNGFEGNRSRSLKDMLWYVENKLSVNMEADFDDDEEAVADEIDEHFSLKLIYDPTEARTTGVKKTSTGKKPSWKAGRRR